MALQASSQHCALRSLSGRCCCIILVWSLLLHSLPLRGCNNQDRCTLVPAGQQAADPAARQHLPCRGGHHSCPLSHAAAQPAPPQAVAAGSWRAAACPSCGGTAGLGPAQPSGEGACQQQRAQPPAGLWPGPSQQRRGASWHPQPPADVWRQEQQHRAASWHPQPPADVWRQEQQHRAASGHPYPPAGTCSAQADQG